MKDFIRKAFTFLRAVYFYISTAVITGYPFWFGMDFFKTGYPQITKFLEANWGFFIIPSAVGLILKTYIDSNTAKQLKIEKEKNDKLNADIVELSETLKDLSNDILKDFSKDKLSSEA